MRKENYPKYQENYDNIKKKKITMNTNSPLKAFKSPGKDDQKELAKYTRRHHLILSALAQFRSEKAKGCVKAEGSS